MRAVVQRVKSASVTVSGNMVGQVGRGFMVLAGVDKGDSDSDVDYIAQKIAGLRIFPDELDSGKNMSLSISEIGGSVLMVSQFTLSGDTRKGRRPSFEGAEEPVKARKLFDELVDKVKSYGLTVEQGAFGEMMDVALINDGPVTILLDSRKNF